MFHGGCEVPSMFSMPNCTLKHRHFFNDQDDPSTLWQKKNKGWPIYIYLGRCWRVNMRYMCVFVFLLPNVRYIYPWIANNLFQILIEWRFYLVSVNLPVNAFNLWRCIIFDNLGILTLCHSFSGGQARYYRTYTPVNGKQKQCGRWRTKMRKTVSRSRWWTLGKYLPKMGARLITTSSLTNLDVRS